MTPAVLKSRWGGGIAMFYSFVFYELKLVQFEDYTLNSFPFVKNNYAYTRDLKKINSSCIIIPYYRRLRDIFIP